MWARGREGFKWRDSEGVRKEAEREQREKEEEEEDEYLLIPNKESVGSTTACRLALPLGRRAMQTGPAGQRALFPTLRLAARHSVRSGQAPHSAPWGQGVLRRLRSLNAVEAGFGMRVPLNK